MKLFHKINQSYLNKIVDWFEYDLSNKPKRLLLKYVSHNFGFAISD